MINNNIKSSVQYGFKDPCFIPLSWCGKQWLQITSPQTGSLCDKTLQVAQRILASIPLTVLTILATFPAFIGLFFNDQEFHIITFDNVPLTAVGMQAEEIRENQDVYEKQRPVFKGMKLSLSKYLGIYHGFYAYVDRTPQHAIGNMMWRILQQNESPPDFSCIADLFRGKMTAPIKNIYYLQTVVNEDLSTLKLRVCYF